MLLLVMFLGLFLVFNVQIVYICKHEHGRKYKPKYEKYRRNSRIAPRF